MLPKSCFNLFLKANITHHISKSPNVKEVLSRTYKNTKKKFYTHKIKK